MWKAAFTDPIHVGIVVKYYYDDYINFKIPLLPFAKEALLGLRRDKSPYALEPQCLESLLAILEEPQAAARR